MLIEDRTDVEDERRSGWQIISPTGENKDRVWDLVLLDGLSATMITKEFGMVTESCISTLLRLTLRCPYGIPVLPQPSYSPVTTPWDFFKFLKHQIGGQRGSCSDYQRCPNYRDGSHKVYHQRGVSGILLAMVKPLEEMCVIRNSLLWRWSHRCSVKIKTKVVLVCKVVSLLYCTTSCC